MNLIVFFGAVSASPPMSWKALVLACTTSRYRRKVDNARHRREHSTLLSSVAQKCICKSPYYQLLQQLLLNFEKYVDNLIHAMLAQGGTCAFIRFPLVKQIGGDDFVNHSYDYGPNWTTPSYQLIIPIKKFEEKI